MEKFHKTFPLILASLLSDEYVVQAQTSRIDQYSRQLRFEESDIFVILQLSDILINDDTETFLKT